ncbi:hypothetical protein JCM8115_003480 [Rhodotorula mucilaginosa]|nr:hypothetical protein B0A53_00746 [Rhodotorula sp. CCFEE 5036]
MLDLIAPVLAFSFARPLLAATACATLGTTAFVAYWVYRIFVAPLLSPLRVVPGPPSEHPLWGNLRPLIDEDPGRAHADWAEKYGGAVRYRGLLGGDRLVLTDPAALNHVLTAHTYDYAKPDEVRGDLAMVLGKGVVFAEGETHRRQRRLMNPAFAPSNLKAMTPGFFALAYQLRDIWTAKISDGEIDQRAWKDEEAAATHAASQEKGAAVIEVSDWLTRLTLDAIGKAGFGYDFRALSLESDALAQAFASLFSPSGDPGHPHPFTVLINTVIGACLQALPTLKLAKLIPNERIKAVYAAFDTIQTESAKIIKAKREEAADKGKDHEARKDLISILLNNAEKEKLDDEELRGQLTTFLFAGHETISNSLSWVLWALVCAPDKQDRLRREVREARRKALAEGRDELTSEELSSLEYLDAVTREILRLEPALSSTPRVAQRPDLIPLAVPVPSAIDPSQTITHVPVKKGQMIYIGVYAANRNKSIFGQDADYFRPERWLDQENKIEPQRGAGWSGLMTFLAGPRACIGYKFALLEFKAVLSVLIDTFEFDKRDPDIQIIHRSSVITRPFVAGEMELGTRMPLKVRLAAREDKEDGEA